MAAWSTVSDRLSWPMLSADSLVVPLGVYSVDVMTYRRAPACSCQVSIHANLLEDICASSGNVIVVNHTVQEAPLRVGLMAGPLQRHVTCFVPKINFHGLSGSLGICQRMFLYSRCAWANPGTIMLRGGKQKAFCTENDADPSQLLQRSLLSKNTGKHKTQRNDASPGIRLTRIYHGGDLGLLGIFILLRPLHGNAQIDPGRPCQQAAHMALVIPSEDCQGLPIWTQSNAP